MRHKVQICWECGALAYGRTTLSPATLARSTAWRAYVDGGCQGVAPAVAEIAWLRVDDNGPAPQVIGDELPPFALVELLESSEDVPAVPPICPACRAGVRAATA